MILLEIIRTLAAAAGFAGPRGGVEVSWAGESVVYTKPAERVQFGDSVAGESVWFPFSGRLPIEALEDRGGYLRIRDGANDGWVLKADFVLAGDAPAHFSRGVRANPDDLWPLQMRAFASAQRGDYERAIRDYDRAIRLAPTFGRYFTFRGNAHSAKGERDRAIRDYDEAIRLDPTDFDALLSRGVAHGMTRGCVVTVRGLDGVLRLDPDRDNSATCRDPLAGEGGEQDLAIRDFDACLKLDPNHADAYLNRGNAYEARGEFGRATRDYDEAIRLDPRHTYAYAYANRGRVHAFLSDYDRSIRDYDAAIRLDPVCSLAFSGRGHAWCQKGDHDRAIRDYDEAIRLGPTDGTVHFVRAVELMLTRRPGAAEGFLAAIDLRGDRGDFAHYAAILGHFAARQAGDGSAARRFLRDFDAGPDAAWPAPAVRFLRGDLGEPELLELTTDDVQQTEARCYLGLHQALRGRPAEASEHFRWVASHGTPKNFGTGSRSRNWTGSTRRSRSPGPPQAR